MKTLEEYASETLNPLILSGEWWRNRGTPEQAHSIREQVFTAWQSLPETREWYESAFDDADGIVKDLAVKRNAFASWFAANSGMVPN